MNQSDNGRCEIGIYPIANIMGIQLFEILRILTIAVVVHVWGMNYPISSSRPVTSSHLASLFPTSITSVLNQQALFFGDETVQITEI